MGFNFNFYTHIRRSDKELFSHFCYDYCYMIRKDEYIDIQKKSNPFDYFGSHFSNQSIPIPQTKPEK